MSIDAGSALSLRREIYADGAAGKADLFRLIDMGRDMGRAAGPDVPQAFADLLAEVAIDVLLDGVDPRGYIRQADADGLVARLSQDGGLANRAEYDMLVAVIRKAVSVPPALAAFARGEIERAIVSGAAGHAPGAVAPEDIEALRAVVFAATEGSALHVARDSAEALFRIADATAGASDPLFEEFFAGAVGNYLMGVAFRQAPSARETRKAENWLDAPPPGFRGFVSAMFDFDRLKEMRETADADALRNAADAKRMAQAEKIDTAEADWLLARLYRDGQISQAEKRLLHFLKKESPSIAPALAELIDKAA